MDQATAAMNALRIEQDRSLTERKPRLSGAINFVTPTAHLLHLRLHSDENVTISKVRYLEGSVAPADPRGLTQAETMTPGSSIQQLVAVCDPHPEVATVEVECRGSGPEDRWNVLLQIPVFPELADRSPKLRFSFELSYPPPHRLIAVLSSAERLSRLEVAVGEASGVSFVMGGSRRLQGAVCDVSPGARAQFLVRVEREHPDDLELKVRCIGAKDERWYISQHISIPMELSRAGEPKFEVELENPGPIKRVRVKLVSVWPLASVQVTLLPVRNTAFVRANGQRYLHEQLPGMDPEGSFERPVAIGPWAGGLEGWFHLVFDCEGTEGERWEVRETVGVPTHWT